jgi:hypothetical protein
MKISNLLPLIGAVALCANICAGADDNEAQAAARAALMQKMNDLDSQQAEPASNQPSPPAPAETQPVMPPPAPEPVAPAATAEPPAPPVEAAPVAPEVQPAAPAPVEPEVVMPVAPPAPVVTTPMPEPPTESVRQNYMPVQRLPSRAMNYPGKKFGFKPIEPPPSPVSAEKEAALQALLDQYKADQITPEQYQVQRAEILNAP